LTEQVLLIRTIPPTGEITHKDSRGIGLGHARPQDFGQASGKCRFRYLIGSRYAIRPVCRVTVGWDDQDMTRIAYEDLTPGRTFDLGKVEIDRAEMVAFARRFDPQPFHLDEEAGRRSVLGGLCASGWFTASLWMRAYVDTLLHDSTSQGSPGGSELSWTAPVFPGDVLHFQAEIESRRRSTSKPNLGLVQLIGTADRAEERVMRFVFLGMFGTRKG
jgi:acyl dehydratase